MDAIPLRHQENRKQGSSSIDLTGKKFGWGRASICDPARGESYLALPRRAVGELGEQQGTLV